MELKDDLELENTRAKLRMLEDHLKATSLEPAVNQAVRDLSRRSIRRMINQLKEEIARYLAHHRSPSDEAVTN